MTSKIGEVAAFMLRDMIGVRGGRLSAARLIDYATTHRDAITFGHDISAGNTALFCSAGIRATYACAAHHGVNRGVIAQFAHVLRTGNVSGPNEWAALRLREYLMSADSPWYGAAARSASARKAHRALEAFTLCVPLRQLKAPDTYVYPAPN